MSIAEPSGRFNATCFVSIMNPERKEGGGMIGTVRQGGCKDRNPYRMYWFSPLSIHPIGLASA